jgi:NADH dehydrogenase
VGGGFAGLAAVKALKNAPVQILLIDRRNHHVFQPLLYQVPTAELAPEDVAAPIRELVRKRQNTIVAMAEVTGVDLDRRQVLFNAPDRARPLSATTTSSWPRGWSRATSAMTSSRRSRRG